jgi:predicted nucleic acid-binding protein
MNRLAFFDTNIFVDADDKSEPVRQARAIQLIARYQRAGLMVISIQVLQEYFAAATRKLRVDPETGATKSRSTRPRSSRPIC